jgi:hypothetical protein
MRFTIMISEGLFRAAYYGTFGSQAAYNHESSVRSCQQMVYSTKTLIQKGFFKNYLELFRIKQIKKKLKNIAS